MKSNALLVSSNKMSDTVITLRESEKKQTVDKYNKHKQKDKHSGYKVLHS